MEEDIVIPIVFFFSLTVIFCLWFYFRHKSRAEMQQTFRLALEKGSELSPEFVRQLGEPERTKDKDLRLGLIWLALGIAMLILGFAINDPEVIGPMAGSASFPGLIGIAYLIMWRYGASNG